MPGNTVTITGYDGVTYTVHPRTLSTNWRVLTKQDWGVPDFSPLTQPAAYGQGVVELAPAVLGQARQVSLEMICWCGSEAEAFTEFRRWTKALNPYSGSGVKYITITNAFTDSGGAKTLTMLCRTRWAAFVRWAGDGPEFLGKPSAGVIRIPLELETYGLPLWRVAGAGTTVAISTTPQVLTINNTGEWPAGFKVVLGSLSGTWTSLTIAPATAGGPSATTPGTVVWSKAGGFANADYLDWRSTDPNIVQWNTGTFSSATLASGWLVAWPGSNTYNVTGAGGTSGTGTVSWFEWLS